MIPITSSSPSLVAYDIGNAPYIGSNSNNPMQGALRYLAGQLQVFDGNSWILISTNLAVGMNPEAESAITWAKDRMHQERQWKELAEKYPAVANALQAKHHAEAQLDIVSKLCGELDS